MRRFPTALITGAVMAIWVATASAGNFAPEPLRIAAPSQINIEYGRPLTFPFTLSGGPATVGLAIFTRDRAQSVRDVRNGYLGWHYMNYVDTCMYLSPPQLFQPGNNTIVWDGRDERGYHAIIYQHRYYLWAYGAESPPRKATGAFRGYGFGRSSLITRDEQGNPLANPVLFSAARPLDPSGETWNTRARWVIGGDPDDLSLLETTRYRSLPDKGLAGLYLRDTRFFFTQTIEDSALTTRKWRWTPNGDAILQTDWGEDGVSVFPTSIASVSSLYNGPIPCRDRLISFVVDSARKVRYLYLDPEDGSPLTDRDLGMYPITEAPNLAWNDESIVVSLPEAALFQVIDPYAEDMDRYTRWANGPGDGFGDTLPAPGMPHGAAMDRNGFVHFADNGSGPSIGLFAPDGTGAGLFPLPGMAGSHMDGMQVIDTGSAFDGIYFGTSDHGGEVRQVRFAMCEGMVNDPAEWWHPHVFIVSPWEGDSLPAGKTFPVTWHGVDCGAVRIEFSSDDGASWTTVASNVAQANFYGDYLWTVPDVRSSTCRLRLTSTVNPLLVDISRQFTISGVAGVEDGTDTAPHALTVSNSPNPFNPSTVVTFTLPRPGTVTLTVYDITGRKVAELAHGFHSAGKHTVAWNASGCASGVYFCVLKAGNAVETRKMLLVR